MRLYSFEKLDVWQKSRQLAKDVYILTSAFPKEEKFGLVSQIRRSVISVSSNIAEGSGRHSYKDKARFTAMAFASLLELLSQLIISFDLGYLEEAKLLELRKLIEEVGNKLNALKRSQLDRLSE